mgnify:CR=1 FL=1
MSSHLAVLVREAPRSDLPLLQQVADGAHLCLSAGSGQVNRVLFWCEASDEHSYGTGTCPSMGDGGHF